MSTARTERVAFLTLAAGVIAAMALAIAPDLAHATTHSLHHAKDFDARTFATLIARALAAAHGGAA